ncbi:hypothetical protein K458DRAFT_385051 [Lentithecium fluviatile CBS 122367]|uniref:Uncharacterized protein n=1 Tax=Lentithecium fluviatile CBS 122367 TaxID=1168545 RepID=A0A6G1JFD2_9PLEO|nr:hypothetical protein K458DRAFT_385051 [Lentithecium fluviatile CBS 122367]
MPPWTSPSPLVNPSAASDEEYIDALDSVFGLSPSAQDEMDTYLTIQLSAEHDPNSIRNAHRARAFTNQCPSMDAEILKDPVKQKEVREITNYKEHTHEARARRYKRCWDKPRDADLSEIVQYTGDEEANRGFKEVYDRRHFELAKGTFVDEREEYDDCFVAVDDPEGWVYIDQVTVEGVGYTVLPAVQNGDPGYSLACVNGIVWKMLGRSLARSDLATSAPTGSSKS